MAVRTTRPRRAAPAFACEIEATPGAEALLAHLDATGILAVEHLGRQDGSLHVVLREDEIEVVTRHGLAVKHGEPLIVRDKRTDGGDSMPGADIATGFVSAVSRS